MITTPVAPVPVASAGDKGSGDAEGEPAHTNKQHKSAVAPTSEVTLRCPAKHDGQAIHQLIKQCPPLDLNSIYTYLLLCEHFSQTCVVAEVDGRIVGFVSAYIHPEHKDVLFVWQVAVCQEARGMALGQRMLDALLERPAVASVRFLETTVGPDNVPSRRMFNSLAASHDAAVHESALFESALFGAEQHDDECLIRIGPVTLNTTKGHSYEN